MQKDIKLIQLEEMDNKGQDVNKMWNTCNFQQTLEKSTLY